MTFTAKVLTATMFTLIAVLSALILSLSTPAYDGAISMQSRHSTAQVVDATPVMMGSLDTVYYSNLTCPCPVSLPPTSGEVDTIEAIVIIIQQALSSFGL